MSQTRDLTDLTVILPIAVSCVTVFSVVVSVTAFVLYNRFKVQQLEKDLERDGTAEAERRDEEKRLDSERWERENQRRQAEQRENEESLKVIHARIDAETTRLRLELEGLRKENQERDERSRARDEQLSDKIAALNVAVVELRTEFRVRHNGDKPEGCE